MRHDPIAAASAPPPLAWPRPPACLTAAQLDLPPSGARVAIAGIVLCRQRPGTAKGVIFLTLEDETGTANIVIWANTYERFRRAVIAGRCLRVTGRLQREGDVVHVAAERIEDISALLDQIIHADAPAGGPLALLPVKEPHLSGSRPGTTGQFTGDSSSFPELDQRLRPFSR